MPPGPRAVASRPNVAGLLTDVVAAADGATAMVDEGGVLAVFRAAGDALRAAIEMQRRIEWEEPSCALRIGIAAADVQPCDASVQGPAFDSAIRLARRARAGEALADAAVRWLCDANHGMSFTSAGTGPGGEGAGAGAGTFSVRWGAAEPGSMDAAWRSALGGDPWTTAYASSDAFRAAMALGRTDAARATLERLGTVAESGRFSLFRFMTHAYGAVLALAEGRFDDAEACAEQAHALGQSLGTEYDDSGYGLQMYAIRREQGRLAEAVPVWEAVARIRPGKGVWRRTLYAVAWREGAFAAPAEGAGRGRGRRVPVPGEHGPAR